MTQKQRDILTWVFITVALFLLLYWTEQVERGKVAGRILLLTAIFYRLHAADHKLKK